MSEWPLRSLSEFIKIKHGFAFKGEFFNSEKTTDYLVTPGNFAIGGGFKADKFKYYDGPVPNDYILKKGDLVITMTDLSKQADTLGYAAFIPAIADHRLLHNQRVGLVEFKNDELDKTYLYFLLRSREYRNHVLGSVTGTTVKHTSPTKILSCEFKKPPFEIQVEIGKQLIAFEEKIELNRQTNQTLEQIAQAIFKSWFVDFEPTRAKIAAKQIAQANQNGQLSAAQKQALLSDHPWPEVVAAAIATGDPQRAAMAAISGKGLEELEQLSPQQQEQLKTTADLFPDALVESELGEIPRGWAVKKIGDCVARFPVGKKFSQKTSKDSGKVPVLDQGKSGIIGYHDEVPGVRASKNDPIMVFANHTCYMRLIMHDFSAIQNVLPFKGRDLNIFWIYEATLGKQKFIEYKGHWPDFEIKKIILPAKGLDKLFGDLVEPIHANNHEKRKENTILSSLRDRILPKLVSGEITISEVI